MRWYYIKFIPTAKAPDPKIKGFVLEYGSSEKTQTLFNPNGANLPGALEVEFNFDVSAFDQRIPDGHIRIYNPPLAVIQNAAAYLGMTVTVNAGFASYDGIGLPLSNVNKSGLIGYGNVTVSYANWVGGDLALDLVISPALQGIPSIEENPNSNAPYQFKWIKDQTFQDAIKATFKPLGFTKDDSIKFSLPENLKWPGYEVIISANDVVSFSNQLRRVTAKLLNESYNNGVTIVQQNQNSILVSTSTSPFYLIDIEPQDIVGQPTISYTGSYIAVQSVHPMRADIKPGVGIKMKKAIFNFQPGQAFQMPKPLTKQDQIMFVQKVRQIGKFRDASYQGWVTVLESGVFQA